MQRISSNNSRGRLFLFSHQKAAIIRGRRLFQIFLREGRALNICFMIPLNHKNHIKYKANMGFLVFQICFVDYGNQYLRRQSLSNR